MCFVINYNSDSEVRKLKQNYPSNLSQYEVPYDISEQYQLFFLMKSVADGDYTGETILNPSQKVIVSGIWGLNLTQEPTLTGHRTDCLYLCHIQLSKQRKQRGERMICA